MPQIAFYKDAFLDINDPVVPIQDRAHQFGDGIYEVIRVYNGQPFCLEEHLNRLDISADAIQLMLPYSREELITLIQKGLSQSLISEAEVYLQVSRGAAPRLHSFPDPQEAVLTMVIKEARTVTPELKEKGIEICAVEEDRWKNCYIKSLNLLSNVLAKQKAKAAGCQESIYVDEGIVKEGSSSNIFCVSNGELYTYPAKRTILHGITRQKVIDLAEDLQIPVHEIESNLSFFERADEVFITSTTMEVQPVKRFGETSYPDERPVIERIQKAFEDIKHQ